MNRQIGVCAKAVILAYGFLICVLSGAAFAQEKPALVKEVRIQGNLRVEDDGIRLHLKSRAGEPFNPELVEQDVKSIYRMGYFDDVKVELSDDRVLTYTVRERPYIKDIKIDGNSQITREKIETALAIRARTVLDKDKISEGVEKVQKLYAEQGYVSARIDFAISPAENNQAVVQLHIEEGQRLLISKISFEGNRAFSAGELTGLMATKEQWFLSVWTNRGVLDSDILSNDVSTLRSHYYDHGYIQVKVDEPIIIRDRQGIEVVIRIEEGEQYRLGKVELGGDMIEEPEKLLQMVKLTSGQIFRGSRLREDIATLSEKYRNRGFAFVNVEPNTRIDNNSKTIDVALIIARGPPVYFDRVLVAGNTKTRDKVVRRELATSEQELFSGNKIKRSRDALQRTGYFEDVQLTTKRTDRADTVDLLVDVKEGPTGTFSIGAGYSTGDSFIFQSSISEKNLFGRGQSLSAAFNIGGSRQDFLVSFTEPYFRDRPLAVGVDAFNQEREFTDFDSRKIGFGIRTTYPLKELRLPFLRPVAKDPAYEITDLGDDETVPLVEYLKGGVSYQLTQEKISGIDSDATASIQDEAGTSLTSSVTPALFYDSRDHYFNATEGTLASLAVKFAGLGGDSRFLKTDTKVRWHYPLLKDSSWGGTYALALGGALGYGVGLIERDNGKTNLPLFERYFPGGMDSVRGFQERSLGPRERKDPIGGDNQLIFNAELLFPVMEQYGLRGVAFFDMGQAFAESENISFGELRRSIGVGGRWLSPFGPFRVELGFPLNKKPGDETSVLGFSLGAQP